MYSATMKLIEPSTFSNYRETPGNYQGFTVMDESMNGGGLEDTPAKADILGKEVCLDCLEKVMNRAKYGFVINWQGELLHRDIAVLDQENSILICIGRNRAESHKELRINFEEVEGIDEVVKRSY